MKKILICLSMILIVLSAFTASVNAEDYDKEFEYDVTFTADGTIVSDYDPSDAKFNDIEPGDNMKITFNLKNEYNKAIDWYMYNTSEAFESNTAKNASYEYQLTYSGMSDDIYNSETVGGDNKQGIEEATSNLEEYFLLDQGFAKGKQESVTLIVKVDGETSINNYQNAMSDVVLRFAVEIPPEPKEEHVHKVVYIPYTGDTTNLTFYIIAEVIALILLLAVLVAYYCYRRKQREA